MKECIEHKKPCKYYKRSTNASLCDDCLSSMNKTRLGGGAVNESMDDSARHVSGDKEKVLPIDFYAEEFFQTIKKKYDEMENHYESNK